MSGLRLLTLGTPRLERDGVPLELRYRKNLALITYLAVTGQRHTREALLALLWPEREPARARTSLRRNLSLLRKALADQVLLVDRETVGLAPEAALWLDVDQFRRLLSAWREHGHPQADVCAECLVALGEAVELYRGDFLSGFSLRDSLAFDEWQFFQAEELRHELASALERLVRGHSAQGAYEQALPYARRWLALDPLHEPAHRHLMTLYAQTGQRAAALRQFQECARVLEAELGLSPSRETRALYERLRAQPTDREISLVAATPPRHNLPAQTTSFVGREAELAEIDERLQDPACRLLTLVGPGGIGKTRLAVEAAAERLEDFQDGVYFVPLAALDSAEAMVPTLAQALGLSLYGGGDPRQQLLNYLRPRNVLLLLDNMEHLLDGVGLIADILQTAPGAVILSTSRIRLNAESEHLFHVGGMEYPTVPSSGLGRGEALRPAWGEGQYSAVQLFMHSARRVRSDLQWTDDDWQHVARICRLVRGMPLAILIAASWAEMLSPAEIAVEIERSIDFLAADLRDLPERQRSVRAVFDHSWRLLTERERGVLQGLSVFRGGFTREAAQQVTGASLRELMSLISRSLLHRTPIGRYQVHELLRQYAAEKLDGSSGAGQAMRDRHCAYYAAALHNWGTDLKGARRRIALQEMGVEIDNARVAWDRAVERAYVEQLDRAVEGLCFFYWERGRYLEGETICRIAAHRLSTIGSPSSNALGDGHVSSSSATLTANSGKGPVLSSSIPLGMDSAEGPVRSGVEGLLRASRPARRVLARLLAWQSFFGKELAHIASTDRLLPPSLSLLEGPELAEQDVRVEKAFILHQLGDREMIIASDLGAAGQLLERSLALYQELGDRWWTARTLRFLGHVARLGGDYDQANRLFGQCLALYQAIADSERVGLSIGCLGLVAYRRGEAGNAERLARECLDVFQKLDVQVMYAIGLRILGQVLTLSGKYAEADSLLEEARAVFCALGARRRLFYYAFPTLSKVKMDLGLYEDARVLAQMGLEGAREMRNQRAIGRTLCIVGSVALAEGVPAEAQRWLQESVAAFREAGVRDELGWALGCLGYVSRALGQSDRARQYVCQALQIGSEIGAFFPSITALPSIALLLADQGEVERAVELYALASRYPYVACSRWFEDVAGQQIAAVTATLPPEVVAAARERGRARDLEAAVKELLAELSE